jgi:alpha-glucosidase
MKRIVTFILFITSIAIAQKVYLESPNKKINIALFNQQGGDLGKWYLKVNYTQNSNNSVVIPQIALGLSRSDQNFSDELKFIKVYLFAW